jgi:hypothetical protein
MRAIVNGNIVETRGEQRGQLCRIDGEFTTTSTVWSSSDGCQGEWLVEYTKQQSSQQQLQRQHIQNASPRRKSR